MCEASGWGGGWVPVKPLLHHLRYLNIVITFRQTDSLAVQAPTRSPMRLGQCLGHSCFTICRYTTHKHMQAHMQAHVHTRTRTHTHTHTHAHTRTCAKTHHRHKQRAVRVTHKPYQMLTLPKAMPPQQLSPLSNFHQRAMQTCMACAHLDQGQIQLVHVKLVILYSKTLNSK